jgi:hypothetical protein
LNVSTTFFALEGVRAYVATVVDGILQSVRGMQSDHEQAEVLLSVLRSPRVDTMTRPAFLAPLTQSTRNTNRLASSPRSFAPSGEGQVLNYKT